MSAGVPPKDKVYKISMILSQKRARSVKVWCTQIERILRIVVQLEQTYQFDQVTDIITYGLLYLWKN